MWVVLRTALPVAAVEEGALGHRVWFASRPEDHALVLLEERAVGPLVGSLGEHQERPRGEFVVVTAGVGAAASTAPRLHASALRRRGPWSRTALCAAASVAGGRFVFVVCSDVAVFLTTFEKKTQKLRREDIARADERFQTMEGGCE